MNGWTVRWCSRSSDSLPCRRCFHCFSNCGLTAWHKESPFVMQLKKPQCDQITRFQWNTQLSIIYNPSKIKCPETPFNVTWDPWSAWTKWSWDPWEWHAQTSTFRTGNWSGTLAFGLRNPPLHLCWDCVSHGLCRACARCIWDTKADPGLATLSASDISFVLRIPQWLCFIHLKLPIRLESFHFLPSFSPSLRVTLLMQSDNFLSFSSFLLIFSHRHFS